MVVPPYFICLRLQAIAGQHWQAIDGQAALKGIDPFDLPVDRFFNYVYQWAMEHSGGKAEQVQRKIETPPAGMKPSEMVAEQEGKDFTDFAKAFGVTPPKSS